MTLGDCAAEGAGLAAVTVVFTDGAADGAAGDTAGDTADDAAGEVAGDAAGDGAAIAVGHWQPVLSMV